MTRDYYYPEFVVVVADGAYDIETEAVFSKGLHDPKVHTREQAVELVCRELYEQGAAKVDAGITRNGLEIVAEIINRKGELPGRLYAPEGLILVNQTNAARDYWNTVGTYTFKEDPDVFKTLYRQPHIFGQKPR